MERSRRKDTSLNAFWAGVVAEELARAGVGNVLIAPGSRNSPLTVAFCDHPGLTTLSHFDERAMSFFAVGESSRTGQPPVICSTSGTATAEFHPAVLEAHESRLPLLVLTADRPKELEKTGANQTTDQNELYGSAVRSFHRIGMAELDPETVKHLRLIINQAVADTGGNNPGPVHLNIPFRKPLEPGQQQSETIRDFMEQYPLASDGRDDGPFVHLEPSSRHPSRSAVRTIVNHLETSNRPMVYFGPLSVYRQLAYKPLRRFCQMSSLPMLADPLSGERNKGEGESPYVAYEHYLSSLSRSERLDPDLVLRFGSPPNASHGLMEFFESTDAVQILISETHPWPDRSFAPVFRFKGSIKLLAERLLDEIDVNSLDYSDYQSTLRQPETVTLNAINEAMAGGPQTLEIEIIRSLFNGLYPEDILFVGNSTPIRDLVDYSGLRDGSYTLGGNRGLSGIDGLISTAAGLGHNHESMVVGVLGDVSFYHDLTGLAAFSRIGISACLVVINNQGGGIFHRLPIEDFDPPFREFLKTEHEMSFESVANQFDATYRQCETADGVLEAYDGAREHGGLTVVECRTDAERSQRFREDLDRRIQDALTDIIPESGGQ
ncbi:MAG: 2-succinyl-5-enolpyruvyl-6-hydroxy-3-cyclohexene-1-carboxylic-acid synthase [bacterium]